MRLDTRASLISRLPLPMLVFSIWTIITAFILARSFLQPHSRTVYHLFSNGARNWLAGEEVYFPKQQLEDHYRYSPPATVMLIPFSLFPDRLGGVFWRLVNFGVYIAGFAWWIRAVMPEGESLNRDRYALLWLLILPLSIMSLNNGQANPLVIGLLLMAAASAARERWNLAAVCVAVACIFKIYPLAVGLLLALLHPRKFGPRMVVAVVLGFALPFACQHFDFVIQQYQSWYRLVTMDNRMDGPLIRGYRDLGLLLRILEVPITREGYMVVQLAAAAGVAALCALGRWAGCPQKDLLTLLTTQATCWMILCGPATEWCTYTLLAPTLAWAVVDAWHRNRTTPARGSIAAIFGLLLIPPAQRMFPDGHAYGYALLPAAAILLWIYLLVIHGQLIFHCFRNPEPKLH